MVPEYAPANDRAQLWQIDTNFVGKTIITSDVEEGVREVALRKGGNTLWNNRVQILKEVWLSPDLGN